MRVSTSIGLIILASACGRVPTQSSTPKDIPDIASMQARGDGSFDVLCRNGQREVRSSEEIRRGAVCVNGNGGGDGLICLARDNDGAAPWIAGRLTASGTMRYANLVYGQIDQCRASVKFPLRFAGNDWVCASRDADGNAPWAAYRVNGTSAVKEANLIYATAEQCGQALQGARVLDDTLILCGSRDRDGANPWSIYRVNANGAVARDAATFNDYGQCQAAIRP